MKKIFYGKAVYDQKEINACIKVLKKQSLSLIDGKNVAELEKKVAKKFGKKFGLMVNSGSSANLLALQSLNLTKNSEIITPTLTFSTTVAPIYTLNLTPSFIDVEKNTFVADVNQIERQINKNTKVIMLPNLLGNIVNWKEVKKIANKYNLYVIEDSADTIGYSLNNSNTGKLTDIVTCSFYASHIISGAGFGGIVCFNDKKQYLKAKLLRGWGRSSAIFGESESIDKRFNSKISGIKYDSKYIFEDFGYNFLPSEISAAFALEQIKKLNKNIKIREKNFKKLMIYFRKKKNFFDIAKLNKKIKTPWLAFPLLIKKNKNFDRTDFQIFLEKKGIQTRTIFTGSILKQPMMKNKYYKKHPKCDVNSTDVMRRGVLLGCHHGMTTKDINYIVKVVNLFLKKRKYENC